MSVTNLNIPFVRVVKSYRNGSVVKVLPIFDIFDSYTESDIEEHIGYVVEKWASNEPSGQNNGYRLDWETITDVEEITKAIDSEVRLLDEKKSDIGRKIHKLRFVKTLKKLNLSKLIGMYVDTNQYSNYKLETIKDVEIALSNLYDKYNHTNLLHGLVVSGKWVRFKNKQQSKQSLYSYLIK